MSSRRFQPSDLVGQRVEVLFDDGVWYKGTVLEQTLRREDKQFFVDYDADDDQPIRHRIEIQDAAGGKVDYKFRLRFTNDAAPLRTSPALAPTKAPPALAQAPKALRCALKPKPKPKPKQSQKREQQEKVHGFTVGMRLEALWEGRIGGTVWYPGVITATHDTGPSSPTFGIDYDDGDEEDEVPLRFLRHPSALPEVQAPANCQAAPAAQHKRGAEADGGSGAVLKRARMEPARGAKEEEEEEEEKEEEEEEVEEEQEGGQAATAQAQAQAKAQAKANKAKPKAQKKEKAKVKASSASAKAAAYKPVKHDQLPGFRAPCLFAADTGKIRRCALGDVAACQKIMEEFGCVVFEGCATEAELAEVEGLFWEWMAGLFPALTREDWATHKTRGVWDTLNPTVGTNGSKGNGVIGRFSVGQSQGMWAVRQLPKVLLANATIWKAKMNAGEVTQRWTGVAPWTAEEQRAKLAGFSLDDEAALPDLLLPSFDGYGAFRNPFHDGADSSWRTKSNWFHLDQHWAGDEAHPHFHRVQGLLNFFGTSAATGSTVLVPGSHKHFEANCLEERCGPGGKTGGWSSAMPMTERDVAYVKKGAVQVNLRPGDYLAWDSRVVHCNQGADDAVTSWEEALPGQPPRALTRLVAFVAMVPRLLAEPKKSWTCGDHEKRANAVRSGSSSGYDPLPKRFRNRPTKYPNYAPPPDGDALWRMV